MGSKLNKSLWSLLISLLMLFSCTPDNRKNVKDRDQVRNFFEFNLKDVPFSYAGSGLALLNHERYDGLALMDIKNSSFGRNSAILKFIYVQNGDTLTPEAIGTPSSVKLTDQSTILGEMSYETEKVLRIKGYSDRLIFSIDANSISTGVLTVTSGSNGSYHIKKTDPTYGTSRFIFTAINGELTFNEQLLHFIPKQGDDNYFELSITETDSNWEISNVTKSFQECIDSSSEIFQDWLLKMPELPEEYNRTWQLAGYTLWSNIIAKGGNYKRDGILMSKNFLHYIWSWDHCFTAMACSYSLPLMAWDQLMVIFDHQMENGQLPDVVCSDHLITSYVKPPIHGWTVRKLIEKNALTDDQLFELYAILEKWTNFWFNERDSNNNGLPEYNHGNDCMDNGTEFDINGEAYQFSRWESANLYAYLVIQMDLLHDLAIKFNKPDEAKIWKERSDKLLDLMIRRTWNGEKFVTINIEHNTINEKSQSIMAYMPIILGKKLPVEIREKLIHDIKFEGFLTKYGLASENPKSPLFEEDGYWRGPIWAPSTMIIVDGLNQCGEHQLAKEISQKYIDICANSGFRENHNAINGKGLRDVSFAWTASVFLILGHEYLMN